MSVKWLLLVLLAWLLCSCSLSESVLDGGANMRKNALSIQAWTARKSDFWTMPKQIRKKDIMEAIAQYLQQDYEMVDAPTSGTINLTGLTIASKKALVIWRDAPTGTLMVNVANTLNDSVGALTSVVILGIQLDSNNQPENPSFLSTPIDIEFTGAAEPGLNYLKKLTLRFLNVNITFNTGIGVRGMYAHDNLITFGSGTKAFYDSEFKRNHINITTSSLIDINAWSADIEFDDNYVHNSTGTFSLGTYVGGATGNYYTHISNSVFKDIADLQIHGNEGGGFVGKVSIRNILIDTCGGNWADSYSDDINYIFFKDAVTGFGVDNKNVLIPWTGDFFNGSFFSGHDVLDIDAVEYTINYSLLEAFFWDSRQSIRKKLATITRNSFEHEFQENVEVGLEHKNTGDEYYRLIHETEMEEVLVNDPAGPMYIKNLTIYNNAGAEYDYRNDQSFLIIARDSSDNVAVFGFINERLYETVFTDVWNNVQYEIEFCFSGKRMPENTKLRNVNTDDNSPISGSLDTQDMTSAVIIR